MANLKFTAEILDDILFRAGEPTDGTSDFNSQALEYLNRAYRGIWMGGGEFVKEMNAPWLWLKKDPPGVLTLLPVDELGTVSVTNNSASATLSTTRAASVANYFLQVDGNDDVFRVSAHTAGTAALTLDSVYTGDTDTAATFRLMKLEYDLAADLLRLIGPMRAYSDGRSEIVGVDLTSLDRDYPLPLVESGTPDRFAFVTETKVRFNRAGGLSSTDFRRVEYDYLYKPNDLTDSGSEEPAVPLQYRQILADAGLFYLLLAKADARAEQVGVMVRAGLQAMEADNRARLTQIGGVGYGHLYPRMDGLRRRHLLRTSSGIILG